MNTLAAPLRATPLVTRITDRHVFVFMAALFVALALAGFVPASLAKIQAVQAELRPPFPLVLHAHAALMGLWLLLLLGQSALAAGGRRAAHRTLGLSAALVLAAIVVTGVLLIRTTWLDLWGPAAAAMPPDVLAQTRAFVSNILLLQGRALIVFPALVCWGLWLRRRDPDAHRRIMLLATAIPLIAGLDRLMAALGWITPSTNSLALDLAMLASIAPLLAWDLLRHAQVHRTTRIWLAVNVPLAIGTSLLWGSNWWLATAPRLMGVH